MSRAKLPWVGSTMQRGGLKLKNDDCVVERTFLTSWKSLDEVPPKYRQAFSQAILFLLPMTDIERRNIYIMGGVALELARSYLLKKDHHTVKDIDMSFRPSDSLMSGLGSGVGDGNQGDGRFEAYIQDIGTRMNQMFGNDLIAKVGDFNGINPPTSQFKMNLKAMKNVSASHVNQEVKSHLGDGWSGHSLLEELEEKMEDIDFIPLVDGSVTPPIVIQNLCVDAERRDFTINAMYLELKFDKELGVMVYLLDPTGLGLNDMKDRVLRTPQDPGLTFWNDPRRLTRIFKMAHKMLVLFGGYTLDSSLGGYICTSSASMGSSVVGSSVVGSSVVGGSSYAIDRVVVEKLEELKQGKMFQRSAIAADLIKVLGSPQYPQIALQLLRCPYLLRVWVAPGHEISFKVADEVSKQVYELCRHPPSFTDLIGYHDQIHDNSSGLKRSGDGELKKSQSHIDPHVYHQYVTLYQSWVTLLATYVVLKKFHVVNDGNVNSGVGDDGVGDGGFPSFGDFVLAWLPSESPVEDSDFLDRLCGARGKNLQGQHLWAGLISLCHLLLYDSENFDRALLQGAVLDGMSKQASRWYRNRAYNYMAGSEELQCFRYQLAELFIHVIDKMAQLNPDVASLTPLHETYFDELYGFLESYHDMIPAEKNKSTMDELKRRISLHLHSHSYELRRLRGRKS